MASTSHPTLADTATQSPTTDALASAYRFMADSFVYPENLDRDQFISEAREDVIPTVAAHLDEEIADSLRAFIDDYETIETAEFVTTHELSPEYPLYLGYYEFDEPETCREIAEADRNQYMVELNAIYEHFGFELESELPDFLPAMIEFLWLTLPDRDDELRNEFITKMASMLPSMSEQFVQADTPYSHLLTALKQVVQYDIETTPGGDR